MTLINIFTLYNEYQMTMTTHKKAHKLLSNLWAFMCKELSTIKRVAPTEVFYTNLANTACPIC